MKFSEKLQKLRKENNLSQEQLADKLDVSRQSVSKWESGQTYPEMDKLLTMCKLFNITLDDLTNDEIDIQEVKPKNKNKFDNLVDDVMYIIDKSYSMFTNMNSKERGKCIGELIILFLILLFFRIPFEYINSIGNEVLYYIPRGGYLFQSLWSFIINVVYLILFIFTFLYIYKTYFLDKYKENKEEQTPKEENKIFEKTNNENIEEKTKEEKIIKEKRHKSHNFGTTLYEILGNIVTFCFKAFLVFISIPFIISFILLFVALFILLVFIFKGIFYFGFVICSIAAIILNWILLKLIFSFLFNYKPKFKIMFTTFIIGLILAGIGSGLTIIDIVTTDIIDELPETNIEYITKDYEFEFANNQVIIDYGFYHNNYEIDETLGNTIKISTNYYKDTNLIEINTYNEKDYDIIDIYGYSRYNKKIIDTILDNLKNKKIYNYNKLYDYEVTIYASSNIINQLKSNYENYRKNNYNYEYELRIERYKDEVNRLLTDNDSLNDKIDTLTKELYELEEENKNLKNKIKEYKENLENILGD